MLQVHRDKASDSQLCWHEALLFFVVGRDAVARRQFCILCVYGWSMLIDVDYANRCCVGSLVAHPVWANCRSSSCAPSTLTGFQLRSTCCVKRDCCKCSIFSRMCACVPVRSWHARCTTDTEYRTGQDTYTISYTIRKRAIRTTG